MQMAETVLQGIGVTQRFGGLTAVNHVDFVVEKNEVIGIIGPNGAGKTTLFNDITGVYSATEGKILRHGEDITKKKPHEITSMGLARTFQNIRLFGSLMAIDNVIVGMHTKLHSGIIGGFLQTPRVRRENREAIEKAEKLLKMTGLFDYRYHFASSLPYGLQRRLEIARAMASEPEILLLDEPAELHEVIIDFMDLPITTRYFTSEERPETDADDIRGRIAMKKPDNLAIDNVPYSQMWTARQGFVPDLSILDLMMNMGREGIFTLMAMTGSRK